MLNEMSLELSCWCWHNVSFWPRPLHDLCLKSMYYGRAFLDHRHLQNRDCDVVDCCGPVAAAAVADL